VETAVSFTLNTSASKGKSLFAKNDASLRQIIRRKLHRHLIAGHNANEMLPHFPRDMCKDIALAWEIDSEHRAGKHLRHRAFGYYRSFLRHGGERYRATFDFSRAAQLIERDGRKIFPKLLSFPPRAGLPKFAHSCESISIKHRANVAGWLIWKRITREQPVHVV